MFPAPFDYVAPSSLQEAVQLLSKSPGEAKVLAGGHSLLPLMKLRLAAPKALIDIGRIPGLAYIRQEGDTIAIGAMTTHHQVASSELLERHAPLLAETAAKIGDVQVRNRGTIGGSLAHADPAGDYPAAVLALGATVKAVGPRGERTISIDDFFVDLLTTALAEDEILTEVRVPVQTGRAGGAYLKFDNPASHYALVGIAAQLRLGANDTIEQIRIGVTGVGPKAYRATGVEQALVGQAPTDEAIAAAAASVADGVDVNSDIHASAEYRAHLARVYTRRAVAQAVARARGG